MNLYFFRTARKIVCLALVIGLFFCKTQSAYSAPEITLNNNQQVVIEHLRIKVPSVYRKEWLSAEERSWEPWLAKKNGFLGRQLLWDPQKEEATLLISWSSREKWKNIPEREIEQVQERFEKIAREKIGKVKGNPFPLVFEGELLPQ